MVSTSTFNPTTRSYDARSIRYLRAVDAPQHVCLKIRSGRIHLVSPTYPSQLFRHHPTRLGRRQHTPVLESAKSSVGCQSFRKGFFWEPRVRPESITLEVLPQVHPKPKPEPHG